MAFLLFSYKRLCTVAFGIRRFSHCVGVVVNPLASLEYTEKHTDAYIVHIRCVTLLAIIGKQV